MAETGSDGKVTVVVNPGAETKNHGNSNGGWVLHNSDQPAKDKLGFVDGSIKPPQDPVEYKKWKPVDSMVKSWLTNSLTKELSESFMFCNSAKELWDNIVERYSVNNGPKFYQVQRQTVSLEQKGDSVTGYFNKLNRCWDELNIIKPVPKCTCGLCSCFINKRLDEHDSDIKLVQFLMGLHLMYDALRGQIMNLDPLPTVNKAFSMVVRQETQKEVNLAFNNIESSAMMAKSGGRKFDDRKNDKAGKYCDHCNQNGHTRDSCFKIIGFPDWYKDLKEQKKKAGKKGENTAVNMTADTPIDFVKEKDSIDFAGVLTALQEIAKVVKNKAEEQVNFANIGEFAGKISNSYSYIIDNECWIIDTGASSHICSNKHLMTDLKFLKNTIPVHLPDGYVKNVNMIGNVIINPDIKLMDVLFIPTFKYNLMSVNKLAKVSDVIIAFDASHCLVQDQRTRKTLIEARVAGNLYVLKQKNIVERIGSCISNDRISTCNDVNRNLVSDVMLWHHRLGHATIDAIKHVDGIKLNGVDSLPNNSGISTVEMISENSGCRNLEVTRENKMGENSNLETEVVNRENEVTGLDEVENRDGEDLSIAGEDLQQDQQEPKSDNIEVEVEKQQSESGGIGNMKFANGFEVTVGVTITSGSELMRD
ncbi:uncharacterized protein G2W53_042302 [Senna tora]|uniref:Retrovirus-related Pol polyprotein from transposon TNT 1-94-like beta-barrel domain-containing protein n=1 Tax=Senna tora TaxID=362788 RepID=A0A834SGL2_9FABA|nr:uncharacterized protein G2W53_042302 [Senna tora]